MVSQRSPRRSPRNVLPAVQPSTPRPKSRARPGPLHDLDFRARAKTAQGFFGDAGAVTGPASLQYLKDWINGARARPNSKPKGFMRSPGPLLRLDTDLSSVKDPLGDRPATTSGVIRRPLMPAQTPVGNAAGKQARYQEEADGAMYGTGAPQLSARSGSVSPGMPALPGLFLGGAVLGPGSLPATPGTTPGFGPLDSGRSKSPRAGRFSPNCSTISTKSMLADTKVIPEPKIPASPVAAKICGRRPHPSLRNKAALDEIAFLTSPAAKSQGRSISDESRKRDSSYYLSDDFYNYPIWDGTLPSGEDMNRYSFEPLDDEFTWDLPSFEPPKEEEPTTGPKKRVSMKADVSYEHADQPSRRQSQMQGLKHRAADDSGSADQAETGHEALTRRPSRVITAKDLEDLLENFEEDLEDEDDDVEVLPSSTSKSIGQDSLHGRHGADHELQRSRSSMDMLKPSRTTSAFEDEHEVDEAPKSVEEQCLAVFKKVQEHNEIHIDDAVRALELLGFASPNHQWVQEGFREVTQYNTIEFEEFVTFVNIYKFRQHEAYAAAFAKCDEDGSGLVEASELAVLLQSFGIEPMAHVLQEVIYEVDEDGRGTLDLEEFKTLMDMIIIREGFTKSEYDELMSIHTRFDRDGSGESDTTELTAILNWLGFAWTADKTQAVIEQVDIDGSGSINQREFLMCMRKVRESELKEIKDMMLKADVDGDGNLSREEIPNVLRGLGYDPWDTRVISEVLRESGLSSMDELDISEMWRLLLQFRKAEGFCKQDLAKIDEAFTRHDKDNSGELTNLEVPCALRDLGYTASFEVMQSVIAKVDVDDTGALDLAEFRKMIRMLQEKDMVQYREAFRLRLIGTNHSALPFNTCLEILESLGFTSINRSYFLMSGTVQEVADRSARAIAESPTNNGRASPASGGSTSPFQRAASPAQPTTLSHSLKDKFIEEDLFNRACCRHARDQREVFKANGGWTMPEVEEFQQMFDRYDPKKTGKITNKNLVKLVDYIFPDMARDRQMRPQLQEMMKTVAPRTGSLTFKDFLQLMRIFREIKDKERAQKEMTAVRKTGFSSSEVAEFRELFLASDDESGKLCFDEFRWMIHNITPLGDQLTQELNRMFWEFTGKAGEADFPEYLLIMKHLMDMNFANLHEKAMGHFANE